MALLLVLHFSAHYKGFTMNISQVRGKHHLENAMIFTNNLWFSVTPIYFLPFYFFVVVHLTETANPSYLKRMNAPLYFPGNCSVLNTKTTIKRNFVQLLNGWHLPPGICNECNEDTVHLECGSDARKRRRSAIREVMLSLFHNYIYLSYYRTPPLR